MSKIKCIIVDDEPLAQEVIAEYIERLDFLSNVGQFDDALTVIEFLSKEQVDLIFLDIQMPVLDGINFLKGLAFPPQIIFTTAHRHYAVEGFDLNALDYLVKPIPFYRFIQAIRKLKKLSETTVAIPEISEAAFFKVDKKKIKVNYSEILVIESLKDYIKVVLKDRSFVTYQTLSGVLALLPDTQFVQVHKSFIINFHHIQCIEGNIVEISDYAIPIGRSYKDEALSKIYSTGKKVWK